MSSVIGLGCRENKPISQMQKDGAPRQSPPVLAITGPTACGKSGLALAVAEAFGGVVINADSMQVYRELRVLTARPTPADEARAPHRLYGFQSAAEPCSAEQWRTLATREIDAALADGKLPVLVGGTGLYLRALMRGLVRVPEIPAAVRASVRDRQARLAPEALHAELAARDPAMAARLRPRDQQRVARALEVIEATGHSLSAFQDRDGGAAPPPYDILAIAALPPREWLYRRIEARLDAMVRDGALEEVRTLLDLGLDPRLPAMKAVGVPELAAHLRGETSLEDALAAAKTATRRYAKRQLTWLRHQTGRDFAKGVFLCAQFSESLEPIIFNEIRASVLTTQP